MNHPLIQPRVERWRKLLRDDPAIRYTFLIYYEPDLIPKPIPRPDNTAVRREWAWDRYQRQLRRLEWLDDDVLPYLDCLESTTIFPAAFGCPVEYLGQEMPFALPVVNNATEAARLKVPSLDTPVLRQQFEFADELRRRAGPEALLRIVDIQSPMGIVAMLWEKSDLFMAMIETPDVVRELAAKVRQLLVAFFDEWFARYGRGYVAHCPEYYMENGLTLSEDEVGAVSPAVFADLFLPELAALSRHFGGLGIHCCAQSRHLWDQFKQIPGLKVLNIHLLREFSEPALTFFGRDLIHYHRWMGDGPAWEWAQAHPHGTRAVLTMTAKTREDAIRFADRLRRVTAGAEREPARNS